METYSYTGYQAKTKRVVVAGITNESKDEILDFAMREARETHASLFGYTVGEVDHQGHALVQLHVD